MTPDVSVESQSNSFGSRMSVAQQKEAHELRKTLKPLMEKRRRARINHSLSQLKTLILPLVGKDASRYSRLEKADILEMTVWFLRNLPKVDRADSYRDGYLACSQRISAVLPLYNLGVEIQQRVSGIAESQSGRVTPRHGHAEHRNQPPSADVWRPW